jgi:ketosteroid isomerase-like protein
MKPAIILSLLVLNLGFLFQTNAQNPSESELYALLKSKDSLLFDAAFNKCDIETMQELFTEDFEFYHDKGGATLGREAFLAPVRKGCADRVSGQPQPAKRILLDDSLKVYPLYNQGTLYGAIQEGVHRFEFLNERQQYQKGDIAKFTHIWIKTGDSWKIKRELSFDHQPSEPSHQSSSN